MLVIRDVVVDPVLSNVSIGYKNEMYIAELLMPVFQVKKQQGKYYEYDKAMWRQNDTRRAPGSAANEVEYGLSTATFYAEDHALKEKIPHEIIDQADSALAPETDAVENITEMLLVDKEIALATVMSNTATGFMTENTTLSGTDQWSDYTNSDPLDDVKTGMQNIQKKIGRKPNTLVLCQDTFDKLIEHPDVIEKIKYSQLGVATTELLARLFQVERVIIGAAIKNSATEGATDSLGYIWSKHAWLIYIAPTKRLKQPTFGWTFTYKNRKVEKWDNTDSKSRFVRTNDNYVQKLVAAEAAYLIKAAIA